MTKSKVALVRCDSYETERVSNAVKAGVELLGGIEGLVRPHDRIVVKPNVLIGSNPDKCVTTHPSVIRAVARWLLEAGADVSVGDSSAFGGCEFNARRSGIKRVADELGITMADFDHGREVSHKSALLHKRFVVANGVLDADGVISLPKLKTHGLVRMTGAVKNQFGCIPGMLKSQFHAMMADPYDFATMLVDLTTLVRPRLYVMDAIIAMEGNGPRNGKPRQMNALLFSTDPVALDAVACRLIDLNPEFVPTSRPGEASGLGTYRLENIDAVGEDVESFRASDFQVVREPPVPSSEGRIRRLIRDAVTARPVIDKTECSACGTCIDICPAGNSALDWMSTGAGKRPRHDYSHCIRCYCCQEICPEGAIALKVPILGRLLFRARKNGLSGDSAKGG